MSIPIYICSRCMSCKEGEDDSLPEGWVRIHKANFCSRECVIEQVKLSSPETTADVLIQLSTKGQK